LGKECNFCHGPNHFASVCRKKLSRNIQEIQTEVMPDSKLATDDLEILNIYFIESELNREVDVKLATDDIEILNICSIESESNREVWRVKVKLNNTIIVFKVDTGAEGNVVTVESFLKILPRPLLQQTNCALKPYGTDEVTRPIGQFFISGFRFFVVNGSYPLENLLGLHMAKVLGLIKICDDPILLEISALNVNTETECL